MARWKTSSEVQTLLFDRDGFSVPAAQAWARTHEFRAARRDVDVMDRYIHIRQRHPDAFAEMRTITFGDHLDGIKAVVGPLRADEARANPRRARYAPTIMSAADAGTDPIDKWIVSCDRHGCLVGADTRREARTTVDTREFCDECRDEDEARANPKITVTKYDPGEWSVEIDGDWGGDLHREERPVAYGSMTDAAGLGERAPIDSWYAPERGDSISLGSGLSFAEAKRAVIALLQ